MSAALETSRVQWGRTRFDYAIRRVQVHPGASSGPVELARGLLEVPVAAALPEAAPREAVLEAIGRWYREHAELRLPLWASKLDVEPTEVLVRDQCKRWASCDGQGGA